MSCVVLAMVVDLAAWGGLFWFEVVVTLSPTPPPQGGGEKDPDAVLSLLSQEAVLGLMPLRFHHSNVTRTPLLQG